MYTVKTKVLIKKTHVEQGDYNGEITLVSPNGKTRSFRFELLGLMTTSKALSFTEAEREVLRFVIVGDNVVRQALTDIQRILALLTVTQIFHAVDKLSEIINENQGVILRAMECIVQEPERQSARYLKCVQPCITESVMDAEAAGCDFVTLQDFFAPHAV